MQCIIIIIIIDKHMHGLHGDVLVIKILSVRIHCKVIKKEMEKRDRKPCTSLCTCFQKNDTDNTDTIIVILATGSMDNNC